VLAPRSRLRPGHIRQGCLSPSSVRLRPAHIAINSGNVDDTYRVSARAMTAWIPSALSWDNITASNNKTVNEREREREREGGKPRDPQRAWNCFVLIGNGFIVR
jgi:hypothetical protein